MDKVWVVDAEGTDSFEGMPNGSVNIISIHRTEAGAQKIMNNIIRENIVANFIEYSHDSQVITDFVNGKPYDVNELFSKVHSRYADRIRNELAIDGTTFEAAVQRAFPNRIPSTSVRVLQIGD